MYLPYTTVAAGLRPRLGGLVLLLLIGVLRLDAQEAGARRPTLGLRGIGALSAVITASRIERGITGMEGGMAVDLGHFGSPRARLGMEAGFLRTAPFREFVEQENESYRDVFHDLSAHVVVTFLGARPTGPVVPYVSFGAGVHALTSAFGSVPIDIRYNTNIFGLRAGAGVRIRGRRKGLRIESGALLAREVSRATLAAGMEWYLGDLKR